MELEFVFCCRSGNTPVTQLSRLLQVEAYYDYEKYYEYDLRDESVLTIRTLKVQSRVAVLDTTSKCSASNDPAEKTVLVFLLKPAVGPPQYMRQVCLSVPTFDDTGGSFLFEVSGVVLPGLPSTLNTLISIGRLLKTVYKLVFRLPRDAVWMTLK